MTSKIPDYSDLIATGSLRVETNIGFDQITRLLKRSKVDLKQAEKILDDDLPIAMDLAYKSMFHASNALVRSQGFRPGGFQQHKGIAEAVKRTLGKDATVLIKKFNQLRKIRNDFEYQAIFHSSKSEIRSAIRSAKEFIKTIEKCIEKQNPQEQLIKWEK